MELQIIKLRIHESSVSNASKRNERFSISGENVPKKAQNRITGLNFLYFSEDQLRAGNTLGIPFASSSHKSSTSAPSS